MNLTRHQLNRLVLELAPVHRVAEHAPSSFADLMASPEIVVWAGACDASIYQDENVNHAFRAWHDWHHHQGCFDFSLAGETLACEAQIKEAFKRYPCAPPELAALLRLEVIGQARHLIETGAFPVDQVQWMAQRGVTLL